MTIAAFGDAATGEHPQQRRGALARVPFLLHSAEGHMKFDTGADVTCVTRDFLVKAGIANSIRPHEGGARRLRGFDGAVNTSPGVVNLDLLVQVMLDVGDSEYVHWDRLVCLQGVWVIDGGEGAPSDLYVAYADWRLEGGEEERTPLSQLAWMVLKGARVLAQPRDPSQLPPQPRHVLVAGPPTAEIAAAAFDGVPDAELREAIRQRIPAEKRETSLAGKLVELLMQRRKIFDGIVTAECTESVEFRVVGSPRPVSFKVPIRKKAQSDEAQRVLKAWVDGGMVERVGWDTPAYGFCIVVPKAGGRWRVTINPTETNKCTERDAPENGFMPESMVREAQRGGRTRFTAQLDLADAFTMLRLGPEARRMSTFTTPFGKMRWKHGYFGWHSFPVAFQRMIMEKVILPTQDEHPLAALLAWIDDLVVGASTEGEFLVALAAVLDRVLALGGRLSLEKCRFLWDVFDWCGVEVDTINNQWRIARGRVAALAETPEPEDREALVHVLGILRYYFFGVSDHNAQRERVALLAELSEPGTVVRARWTTAHTTAMREALDAIVNGEWLLVYDPSQKVWVSTDASGNHGYCIVAWQFDRVSGKIRPISYFSRGWISTQRLWTAQVKEAYAQRQAVCVIMPEAFPFADVFLLCDNKNLAARAESEDLRVRRWQHDIACSGSVSRGWIPGKWNTIADYGSRAVQALPDMKLSEEEQFELNLCALSKEEEGADCGDPARTLAGNETTVVPGHLPMAALAARIATAQEEAPAEEKVSWTGEGYTTATLAGRQLFLHKGRLIVPAGAVMLQQVLLRHAHDLGMHYTGTSRTLWALQEQARVHWVGIDDHVRQYIRSCFKCNMTKGAQGKAAAGTLQPTIAPAVHHTWYADLKGPLPHDTGYLLVVVEAVSRFVKLRYLPSCTAKEVAEELLEAFTSFGTRPVVLRTDGGPPFNSEELRAFTEGEGVTLVLGVPHHSQGQGLVESRIRSIAAAIMATLGYKAPREWFRGPWLNRLEGIINASIVEDLGASPYGVLMGREPRTALAAQIWSSANYGAEALGLAGATLGDINEIIAEHHAAMKAAEQMALLGTTVAQALRKRRWDAAHEPPKYGAGDFVTVRVVAPNRLLPWRVGPYKVSRTSPCGNFVWGMEFVDPSQQERGPFHVSRLQLIDMSRATVEEVASHQLEAGSALVGQVLGHRVLATGEREFHIAWYGTDVTTWMAESAVRAITKVAEYCRAAGVLIPGEMNQPRVTAAGTRGRGGQGGRGRGGRGGHGRGRGA